MSDIFNKKNSYLSNLSGNDLLDFVVQLENYNLEYRDELNLDSELTFGVELEYEGVYRDVMDQFISNNLIFWKSKGDGSLSTGGEVVSGILRDDYAYWFEIKRICDILNAHGADTSHNAGGHIHIGASILGDDVVAWRLFFKLYTVFESVIFRFMYGDKISGRKKLFKYASPTADTLHKAMPYINKATNLYEIFKYLPSQKHANRYTALNLCNVDIFNPKDKYGKNTIEFRGPNASSNPIIWQNNINLFAKMLMLCKYHLVNEKYLDKCLENYKTYEGNEYLYNEVDLKKSLIFSDIVFDNNLDKIYFLKQYLKGFADNYGINTAVETDEFVK